MPAAVRPSRSGRTFPGKRALTEGLLSQRTLQRVDCDPEASLGSPARTRSASWLQPSVTPNSALLTNSGQRIADKHVDNPAASVKRLNQDCTGRLLGDFADQNRFLATRRLAQCVEGRLGLLRGN